VGSARPGEPVRAAGERKLVSVLFADLTGYTALASSLDPEEVYRSLRPGILELQRIVEGFGGVVPQILGDGFMAIFGIPSHEDDAERAVRAALAVRDHVRTLNEGDPQVRFPEVHSGVNSGEVMVAPSAEAVGFAVIGDTVNVASRLADLASGGRILVGERTWSGTKHAVRYGPRRHLRAKGKSGPVEAYEALEPRGTPSGRPARRSRGVFVGREPELVRLLDEAERCADEGRSRVVIVTGDAGLGKTRLAAEFARRFRPGRTLMARCPPFGDRLPLWPLAEALGSGVGLVPGSAEGATEETVRRLADSLPAGARSKVEPGLRLLFGLGGTGRIGGSAQDAMAAARAVLGAFAAAQPLAIVLDDLDGADPDLRRFLQRAHRSPWDAPVLFVGLARSASAFRGVPAFGLEALASSEMVRLARAILGPATAEGVLALPLARAQGNPLFLEETLGMLVEAGTLAGGRDGWRVADPGQMGALPSAIRLLISARLDGLPPHERETMLHAAIAGDTAWDALVGHLSGTPDPRTPLEGLARRGLLHRVEGTGPGGSIGYAVKHVLIREVAYESVPRAERAHLHLRAATWFRGAGIRPEPIGELAHHYERAWELSRTRPVAQDGSTARLAVRFIGRWADQTLTLQARAAEVLYGRALRVVSTAGSAVDPIAAARLRIARAECLIEMGRHREAVAEARRVQVAAERAGDQGLSARALLALGRCETDLGRPALGRRLLQRARTGFRAEGDLRAEGWALHRLSETWAAADLARELDDLREAHRVFARTRDRWGRSVVAQDLAYLLTPEGGREFERWYREAQRLVADEWDLRSRAALLRTAGYAAYYRGENVDALRAMREAAPLAEDGGDRYTLADAVLIGAMAACPAGEPAEAERLTREGLRLARELDSGRIRALALLAGARSAVRAGRCERATERLSAGFDLLRRRRERIGMTDGRLVEALVALDRGMWKEARRAATALRPLVSDQGFALWEPMVPLVRGRAALGAGRAAEAEDLLALAAELARPRGATGTLAAARAWLAQARVLGGRGFEAAVEGSEEPEVLAPVAETQGLIALESGDTAAAVVAMQVAVDRWASGGSTVWLARAQALAASAAHRSGDRRGGSILGRRARRTLEVVGAPPATREAILRPIR